MKELPKVFHNKINKELKNNEKFYYSNNDSNTDDRKIDTSEKNILQKINEIFSSPNYVYKANVEITLKDKKITKRIIGRNKDFIITMDNMLIPINDIIDIRSTKEKKS